MHAHSYFELLQIIHTAGAVGIKIPILSAVAGCRNPKPKPCSMPILAADERHRNERNQQKPFELGTDGAHYMYGVTQSRQFCDCHDTLWYSCTFKMAHVNNRQNQCAFAVESNKIEYGIRARVMHMLSEYVQLSNWMFGERFLRQSVYFWKYHSRLKLRESANIWYMARPDTKLLLCYTHNHVQLNAYFMVPSDTPSSRCTLDVRLRFRAGNTGSAECSGKSQCDSVIASTNDGAY